MKLQIVIVFIFGVKCTVSTNLTASVDTIAKIIGNITESDENPSTLIAFNCWPKAHKIDFAASIKLPTHMLSIDHRNISRHFKRHANSVRVFVDMRCAGSAEFLRKVDESYFGRPFRWILLAPDNDQLAEFAFLPDSEVIAAHFNEEGQLYNLNYVYKISKLDSQVIFEDFGHWSQRKGLVDRRQLRILSRRRRNLHGMVIKSAIVLLNNESINQMDDMRYSHIDALSKHGYKITNDMAKSLNATVAYNIVDDWGYQQAANANVSQMPGMMGLLVRKEVDVSSTIFFMTVPRVDIVDFMAVILPTRCAFIFREPPLSYVSNIYYLPFRGSAWIAIICSTCLCTLLIFVTYRFSMRDSDREISASDFALYAVTAVCQMGSALEPYKLSGKIATFVFSISLIFIYTSYAASIVALLQSTSHSIQTIADLLNTDIQLAVEDVPYSKPLFHGETDPVRQRVITKKVEPANQPAHYFNMTYGMRRMRTEFFAFHSEIGIGYKHIQRTFTEHEKCGLKQIEFFTVGDPYLGIPKNTAYREMIKVNMLKIAEHGITVREKWRVFTKKPLCSSSANQFNSVSMIDCYMALLILCYGLGASVMVLAVEHVFARKCCLPSCRLK